MKKEKYPRGVQESLFPASLFAIYFGVLLLMSGIHSGLIVFINTAALNGLIQTLVPIAYWCLVAVGLTLFTRNEIKKTYEGPLHKMAEATSRVADGDFSVYVPTIHTQDRWDYLDVMIVDFNKMVEELGSIETLKTDFISNVSHEMKTPIAIIKNYAELLRMESLTEEQKEEYARNIEAAAVRLSNLISNILKLNKLENQRITPEVEAYDVCRQVCDCIIQYENAWEEKEIGLETDMEDSALVEADENMFQNAGEAVTPGRQKKVTLRLKRNRKIINKMELTRLQRNFEACVGEIDTLERTKTSVPTEWALIIGILGTAFIAGSTFAVTAQPPMILLCIVLAIPGFLGWILPWFVYKKLLARQTEKMTPLIEEKYDEIDAICEKGSKLLY